MEIKDADIKFSVHHGGKPYPVAFIGEFENLDYTGKGYVDAPFHFKNEGLDANGVLVVIEPKTSTKLLRVLHPSVRFEDAPVAGSGWFLGISPAGEVVKTKVEAGQTSKEMVKYGAGWTFCYIASNRGLVILDTTEPAFKPDMETEVTVKEMDNLPMKFLMQYDKLKSGIDDPLT